jgi:hypothetical protein
MTSGADALIALAVSTYRLFALVSRAAASLALPLKVANLFATFFPRPRDRRCRSLASCSNRGEKVEGHDRPLAGREVAAGQVRGDDPFGGRAAARPFGKAGRYPGDLTGGEAVPPVEDLALVENDRVHQAPEPDVVGEFLKLRIGQHWKGQACGVKAVRLWRFHRCAIE